MDLNCTWKDQVTCTYTILFMSSVTYTGAYTYIIFLKSATDKRSLKCDRHLIFMCSNATCLETELVRLTCPEVERDILCCSRVNAIHVLLNYSEKKTVLQPSACDSNTASDPMMHVIYTQQSRGTDFAS